MQLSVIITSFVCRNTGTNTAPARQKLGAATEHRLKSAENLRMPKVPYIHNVCTYTLAQHNTTLRLDSQKLLVEQALVLSCSCAHSTTFASAAQFQLPYIAI